MNYGTAIGYIGTTRGPLGSAVATIGTRRVSGTVVSFLNGAPVRLGGAVAVLASTAPAAGSGVASLGPVVPNAGAAVEALPAPPIGGGAIALLSPTWPNAGAILELLSPHMNPGAAVALLSPTWPVGGAPVAGLGPTIGAGGTSVVLQTGVQPAIARFGGTAVATVSMGTPPAALKAQALFDILDWCPGVGDVFRLRDGADEGKTTGPTYVRAAKILRARAQGLVYWASNVPRTGKTVNVEELPAVAAAGSGVSGDPPPGYYLTGQPGARSGMDMRADAPGIAHYDRPAWSRWPARVSFRGGSSGIVEVTLTNGRPVGFWIAWTDTDGKCYCERRWLPDLSVDVVSTVDVATDCGEPRLQFYPARRCLSLTWRRGTTGAYYIRRAASYDDGASWVYDADFTGGGNVKHAREVFNLLTGERVFLWMAGAGGIIQAAVYGIDDALIGTYPTGGGGIGGLTADDSSFDACYVRGESEAVECVFVVSNVRRRFRSCDDARTWVEIT